MPARPIDQPPVLKRDRARGYFYVRWGGRLYTFGTDEEKARAAFLDPHSEHQGALHRWHAWAAAKRSLGPAARPAASPLVVDLATAFFASYADRPGAQTYYRKHLARFVTAFGAFTAGMMTEEHLQAFKLDLQKLALGPRTIGHDLKAVKTFWRWAGRVHGRRAVPRLELSEITTPPVPPAEPHPISRDKLLTMLSAARREDELLGLVCELSYMALLRPTEAVRIMRGEGRFEQVLYPDLRPWDPSDPGRATIARVEPRGLFVMTSKVQHRTSEPRYVVLSERASTLLDAVQGLASRRRAMKEQGKRVPLWLSLDSYSAAVRGATGLPPSVLRDTAASDLHSLGVVWGDIDLLLGHVPGGAGRSYIRTASHTLRELVSRLRI